jgi:hypothetical protein
MLLPIKKDRSFVSAEIQYIEASSYTVKKVIVFPPPAGMSLTKLSLARNNLILPGQGEFG